MLQVKKITFNLNQVLYDQLLTLCDDYQFTPLDVISNLISAEYHSNHRDVSISCSLDILIGGDIDG